MWQLLQLQNGDLVWAVVTTVQICDNLPQYRLVRVMIPAQKTARGEDCDEDDRVILRIKTPDQDGARLLDADFIFETLVLGQNRDGQMIASLDKLGNLHIHFPPEGIAVAVSPEGFTDVRKVPPIYIEAADVPRVRDATSWALGVRGDPVVERSPKSGKKRFA